MSEEEEFEFRHRLESEQKTPAKSAEGVPVKLPTGGWGYQSAAGDEKKPAGFSLTGAAETALTLGTAATGGMVGGALSAANNAVKHGLYGLTGLDRSGLPTGEQAFTQGADAGTYQPRSASGQEMAGNAGDFLTRHGPSLIAVAPELALVGRSASQAAKYGAGVARKAAEKIIPETFADKQPVWGAERPMKPAKPDLTEKLDAPAREGIQRAREAGLVITPQQAGRASSLESAAGQAKTERLASKNNAPKIDAIIRKDIGLLDDVPLTREAIADTRAEAGKAYEALKSFGKIENDAQYFKDLDEVSKSYDTAAKSYPHRSENPFQSTLDGLKQGAVDAASAVEEIKLLRNDADTAYRSGDKGLGKAYKGAAKAVDDAIARHIDRAAVTSDLSGDPALANIVKDYHDARTKIAKTYQADAAINETTGHVDAAAYARMLKRGDPLTGGALTVGQFGRQFAKSAQRVDGMRATGIDFGDLAAGGVSALKLGPKGAVVAALRPALRQALMTETAQNMLTKPPKMAAPRVPVELDPGRVQAVLEALVRSQSNPAMKPSEERR